MRRHSLRVGALCGLLGFAAACTSALPHPQPRDAELARARWQDVSVAQLEHGRKSYVVKCSGCHHLALPHDRSPQQWPAVIETMSARARLTPAEKLAIERYIVTMSERSDDG